MTRHRCACAKLVLLPLWPVLTFNRRFDVFINAVGLRRRGRADKYTSTLACRWNFTPSPGWTKEEAQILKLCLMKHGVGRWVQILDSGLLPGKLIQQLNGQTQRLLGQQSLAGMPWHACDKRLLFRVAVTCIERPYCSLHRTAGRH